MNFQTQSEQIETEEKLNTQKMSYICDQIMNVLKFLNKNKEIYKENKEEMLKMVKLDNINFYNSYPRICRSLVFEDDINPLLGMIQTFGKVQEGQMSWEKANNVITGALNAKYVDPILNSDQLVKERVEKQKIIDITKNN
jgi:hypothetical protein